MTMSTPKENVVWFQKIEDDRRSVCKVTIFGDGSALADDGDQIEIIFEEAEDAWREAIKYLEDRGYREFQP